MARRKAAGGKPRERAGESSRGLAEGGATRAKLVAAAAHEFNRAGYHGTDSNRIARAAGYAPGTFYKHFADKREAFLAVWEEWVEGEWTDVRAALASAGGESSPARAIVEVALRHHTRWKGLRASMHALAAVDPVVRRFHRAQRRRQLATLAELRAKAGARPRPTEHDAVLLFTLERACDALALGEVGDLGLSRDAVVEALAARVRDQLR